MRKREERKKEYEEKMKLAIRSTYTRRIWIICYKTSVWTDFRVRVRTEI